VDPAIVRRPTRARPIGTQPVLTISNRQLARLDAISRERYQARLAECLREDFPDETADLSDDDLEIVVSVILSLAATLDIVSEDSAFVYAAMSMCLGIDFARHPIIDALLFSGDATADEKMCELPFQLTDDDFAEISSQSLSAMSLLRESRARMRGLAAAATM
jgi:hypothetical protein